MSWILRIGVQSREGIGHGQGRTPLCLGRLPGAQVASQQSLILLTVAADAKAKRVRSKRACA